MWMYTCLYLIIVSLCEYAVVHICVFGARRLEREVGGLREAAQEGAPTRSPGTTEAEVTPPGTPSSAPAPGVQGPLLWTCLADNFVQHFHAQSPSCKIAILPVIPRGTHRYNDSNPPHDLD